MPIGDIRSIEMKNNNHGWTRMNTDTSRCNAEAGRTEVRSSAKCLVDIYQPLFDYLHDELGSLALESQMQDILNICKDINAQEQRQGTQSAGSVGCEEDGG